MQNVQLSAVSVFQPSFAQQSAFCFLVVVWLSRPRTLLSGFGRLDGCLAGVAGLAGLAGLAGVAGLAGAPLAPVVVLVVAWLVWLGWLVWLAASVPLCYLVS